MRHTRAGVRESRAARSGPAPREIPELPTGKAFVLQLTRDTGPTLEPFAGRVEHLASGRRLRFDDLAAFHVAVSRLLAQAREG